MTESVTKFALFFAPDQEPFRQSQNIQKCLFMYEYLVSLTPVDVLEAAARNEYLNAIDFLRFTE